MGVIVVSQATGQHGWSSFETYVAGVRGLGHACTVHRPHADWGATAVQDDDGLERRLLSGGYEPLLLCGFDWHSQPLHADARMRRAIRSHRGPRIGLFQEHLGAEWIRADPARTAVFSDAARSAAELLTHIACNHEGDVAWLRALGIRLPILYLPFCADLHTFRRMRPMSDREAGAFFRGKRLEFMSASPYAARERMAELLRESGQATVCDLSPNALLDRDAMVRSYVDELNRYRIQLNLPSVSDSLTCRPFEVLACGGALVQTEPEGEIARTLLPPDHYQAIDRERPASALEAIEALQRDAPATGRLAARGHALVVTRHGAERRMAQLLDWVGGARCDADIYRDLAAPGRQTVFARPGRTPAQPRILVDLVFYQYADSGIAQVWNRVLDAWSRSGYARFVTLLLRRESRHLPPAAVVARFETLEIAPHGGLNDPVRVQAACDATGATLFMSTYYSRPKHTRSLLLVHDCIPERLNPDCHAETDWADKRDAIRAAAAYACVSDSTAEDLRSHYASAVEARPVLVVPNEFGPPFAPAPAAAQADFLREHGLRRELLVFVGERIGYQGYKNVEAVCRALAWVARTHPALAARFSLLFVGGERGDGGALEPALERHLSDWHVRRLTLERDELVTAMSAARFVVYPSLIEGFGLPPGEAAMCGTPTIAWDTPINREIYGDGLAYLRDGSAAELGAQVVGFIGQAAAWRDRARALGDALRQRREQRGGSSQAGTLLEYALLQAQAPLDVAAADYEPVLFDAHPSQRAEWLQRLIDRHPAGHGPSPAGFGDETLHSAALVSMYRGSAFAAGCVEDLVEQTAFEAGNMEVLIIDSASPEDEHRLIAPHIARHRNLLYLRSVERESLYRAWNRAARLSRARYLSNANLDDRHRKDFFERLARDLDQHPEVELVYPAQYLSLQANEPFRAHRPQSSWAWPDYTLEQLRVGNHVGSQPMWRRSLHQRIGWFDERYRIAGDYDFWCRIAHRAGPLRLHPVHVGLYCFNGAGIEHGDPLRSKAEVAEICQRYGIAANYETSEADRSRAADDGQPSVRALEDLQYSGIRLERTLNVWIDAANGLAHALKVADSVLAQTAANHHRMQLVFVGLDWSEAERHDILAHHLAPLASDWSAACRFDALDFEQPQHCTVRLWQPLADDRRQLERGLQALAGRAAPVLALSGVHGTAGRLGRAATALLPEAVA
ncbi:MAG: glycosyltransferase [Ideonella sp.]|jgi:glycosyltransferase involved in cell wall biosynthesis|nr:glycosyltransferase [Ideonella sp.]